MYWYWIGFVVAAASGALFTPDARAGLEDAFILELEQQVSDGAPGPGAGNVERTGAVDFYTINLNDGQLIWVDEISGSCSLEWTMTGPNDELIFDNFGLGGCGGQPGLIELTATGAYTIAVNGVGDATGTYSFIIWDVNPAELFEIDLEQQVSSDVPAPGAGTIEEPGATDVYTIDLNAGQQIWADETGGGCSLEWTMTDPDGEVIFDNLGLGGCAGQPGLIELTKTGTYTITVSGVNDGTGTYAFIIWELNPPEFFAVVSEQEVSNGVPAAGAGHIEEPGATDVYTIDLDAGQQIWADETGGSCSLEWTMADPDGEVIFDNLGLGGCAGQPGLIELTKTGTYTITVNGVGDGIGTYAFIIWDVNPPEVFEIQLEELVSDGAPGPGAGNVEEPGAIDIYALNLEAGQSICAEEVSGGCSLEWTMIDPDGDEVFYNLGMGGCAGQPGKYELTKTGEYLVTVNAAAPGDATGTYAFTIHHGRPADLNGDCAVGVPDLLLLLKAWGACPGDEKCHADLGGDGAVGVSDLLDLLSDWGSGS